MMWEKEKEATVKAEIIRAFSFFTRANTLADSDLVSRIILDGLNSETPSTQDASLRFLAKIGDAKLSTHDRRAINIPSHSFTSKIKERLQVIHENSNSNPYLAPSFFSIEATWNKKIEREMKLYKNERATTEQNYQDELNKDKIKNNPR